MTEPWFENSWERSPLRNHTPFSPSEIRQALSPEAVIGPERLAAGISTDSRTAAPGQLFVALQGPRFDGHDFVRQALASGAAGVVVERWPLSGVSEWPEASVWKVRDGLTALGALGQWHRKRFSLPLAAVTGSCGKSTTKGMLVHLLSHDRPVLAASGTENNRIGVPMTLLQMDSTHAAAVLELGTNQWGEIRTLTELCLPTVGVVTNIGPAHLQTFGDLAGVLREKEALWQGMRPEAPIVLNADDLLLREAGRKLSRRVVWFGTAPDADVRATEIQLDEEGLPAGQAAVAGSTAGGSFKFRCRVCTTFLMLWRRWPARSFSGNPWGPPWPGCRKCRFYPAGWLGWREKASSSWMTVTTRTLPRSRPR
jgi:UDP-N-acetylmuramoyl-tripeptide--D-alanyl-D-alanine ligase